MDEKKYMMWLSSLTVTINPARINGMLEVYGSAKEVYRASESSLKELMSLSEPAIAELTKNRKPSRIDELLKITESLKIRYVSRNCEEFPSLLKCIPDAPVGLFCLGQQSIFDEPKIAVVGSRQCTEYGLIATRLVTKPLAEVGTVIVSGMAKGIDSMAHWGAIHGGGKTIAVLGTGVDVCYPAENRNLREEIISKGCLVSEYPPGTEGRKFHFPMRNRIISGLSLGVVVVEAGKKSGALGTADHALAQGREVFAVPGNISSKLSEGTNELIREGACPVADYSDILYVLRLMPPIGQEPVVKEPAVELAPDERLVYDILSCEPTGYEELAEMTELAPGRMHFILTGLEIKKLIVKLPGARFIKS